MKANTPAERLINGILKENSGISRATSSDEGAFFTSQGKQVDTDDFISGLSGNDGNIYAKQDESLQPIIYGNIDSANHFNYNDNNIEKGENYNGENTELLERGTVSAANRGNNLLWQQSANSKALATYLEVSQGSNAAHNQTIWAGECGWLDEKSNFTGEKEWKSFAKSVHRRIFQVKKHGRALIRVFIEEYEE